MKRKILKHGKKEKIKVRKSWKINPRTRIKESEKKYNRTKKKKELKDILKDYL